MTSVFTRKCEPFNLVADQAIQILEPYVFQIWRRSAVVVITGTRPVQRRRDTLGMTSKVLVEELENLRQLSKHNCEMTYYSTETQQLFVKLT